MANIAPKSVQAETYKKTGQAQKSRFITEPARINL